MKTRHTTCLGCSWQGGVNNGPLASVDQGAKCFKR